MNWPELWKEYYGELSPKQIDTWNYELFHGESRIIKLTEDEVCHSIREMRADKTLPPFPKLSHLINQIYVSRKSMAVKSGGNNYDYAMVRCCTPEGMQNVQVAELKRLIRIAETDDQIFNIICRPMEDRICELLQAYALSVHKDWIRPTKEEMAKRFGDLYSRVLNIQRPALDKEKDFDQVLS